MPVQRRQRIPPTDDWEQLQLLTTSAEQRTYELIRPVVLFGQSPAERARETGAPQRTLYRQVRRFATDGMASLQHSITSLRCGTVAIPWSLMMNAVGPLAYCDVDLAFLANLRLVPNLIWAYP